MRRLGRTRTSGFGEQHALNDLGDEQSDPVRESDRIERIVQAEVVGSLTVGNFALEDDELPLLHWIDELVEVARAVMGGRGRMNKQDAQSLSADIFEALDRTGPHLQGVLQADLAPFRQDVAALHRALERATTARPIYGLAARIREQLTTPDALGAAWLDAVDSVRSRESSAYSFFELNALATAFGHEWDDAAKHIQGILHDDRYHVLQARNEPATRDDLNKSAGLSWAERIDLVRTWIAQPVERRNAHAYLTLQGADVPSGYMCVHDAVEIYSAEAWRSVVAGNWTQAPEGWTPPPHITELGEGGQPFIPFVQYTEVEPVTSGRELPRLERLARFQSSADEPWIRASAIRSPVSAVLHIQLPNTTFHAASDRARAAAEELLATAFPRTPWKVAGSVFVALDDESWTRGSHNQPDIERDPLDVTRERLEEMRPELFELILGYAGGSSTTRTALDEQAALHRIAELDDPRQQVVLGARALEHHLPQPLGDDRREAWAAAAERYLLDRWVWRSVVRQLDIVLDEAVGLGFGPLPDAVQAAVDSFLEINGQYRRINRIAGARAVRALLAARWTGSIAHTEMTAFADILDSPALMRHWIDELRARGQRLYRRASRIRNSVIHGTLVPLAVAQHIAPFVIDEANIASRTFLNASLDGVDHPVAFETRRSNDTKRLDRLRGGEHFSSVIA